MCLTITNLSKTYGGVAALDKVNLTLQPAIYGLVGRNGAGKSTLIKLILNMIRRDAGEIRIFGRDNRRDEEYVKDRIGVVFDSSYFIETWTVGVAEKAMATMYSTWDHAAFDGYLAGFGLDRRKKIKELSRGMQMKLMLAVALSHEASLLILDEPTRGIDIGAKAEIQQTVLDLAADGMGVVFLSSELEEVVRLSDDIEVLKDRHKIAEIENDDTVSQQTIVETIANTNVNGKEA